MRLSFLSALTMTLLPLLVFQSPPLRAADDSRLVWEYTGGYGKSWMAHESGKKWIAWLGNATSVIHIEEERTADYIQLLNISAGLHLRLYAGRGELRRGRDGVWKRWSAKGNWTSRDALPEAAVSFPDYKIRVVYFVASDREPDEQYEARIRVVLAYVEELYRGSPSLRLARIQQLPFERDDEGIRIHLVKADQPASFFNTGWEKQDGAQFGRISKYLRENEHDPSRRVTLVIPETWEDGPAQEAWPGHEARATSYTPDGGLAVYSAWILQDRFSATTLEAQRKLFFDTTPVPGRRSFGLREPNSAVFEFVENGIGGVAHELGHAVWDCRTTTATSTATSWPTGFARFR